MNTWKTRDGRRLTLHEMSTEHIKNCVAMLRRNGFCSLDEFDDAWMGLSSLSGEMASYYAESEVSQMQPASIIDKMEAELDRRGEP